MALDYILDEFPKDIELKGGFVVMSDGTTLMWSRRYRAQTAGEFGDG